jgi:hypothetical protein
MEVCGQLHASAALAFSKESLPLDAKLWELRFGLDAVQKKYFSWTFWKSNPDSSFSQSVAYTLRHLSYPGPSG